MIKTSRIGNRIIAIPSGVTVELNENIITVKGAKGTLSMPVSKDIEVEINESEINVKRNNDLIPTKQMHGTTNANITNMIMFKRRILVHTYILFEVHS